MHPVAIDNFEHAKFWLGNYSEFTLKILLSLRVWACSFCSPICVFKILFGLYAAAHALLAPFRYTALTPRLPPSARLGFLEGKISR